MNGGIDSVLSLNRFIKKEKHLPPSLSEAMHCFINISACVSVFISYPRTKASTNAWAFNLGERCDPFFTSSLWDTTIH